MIFFSQEDQVGSIPIASSAASPHCPSSSSYPSQGAPRVPRHSQIRMPLRFTVALVASFGLLLYIVAGYGLFPYLLAKTFPRWLSASLGRPVTVGSARFNPFTITLALHNGIIGPQIANPQDTIDPVLSFSKLVFDFELLSLLKTGAVSGEMHVDNLFAHITRDANGHYNLEEALKPGVAALPFSLSLSTLTLIKSRIVYSDLATNQTHRIEDLNVTFPGLGDSHHMGGQTLPPSFSAKIDGSPVVFSGTGQPSSGGAPARINLRLAKIDVTNYQSYWALPSPFGLSKGEAEVDLNVSLPPGKKDASGLVLDGTVRFNGVVISDRAKKDCVVLPEISVSIDAVEPFGEKRHIREVLVKQPAVFLERFPDGQLNVGGLADWAKGFAFWVAGPGSAFAIDSLNVQYGSVRFRGSVDESGSAPPLGETKGVFNLFGKVSLQDDQVTAEIASEVRGVALAPLSAYLEPVVGYRVKGGKVGMKSDCRLEKGRIEAFNHLTIEGFAWGEPVPGTSNSAPSSLPLMVALLQDTSGRMEFDVPIHGAVGDRNFSFLENLFAALGNLLQQTATAPLSLVTLAGHKEKESPQIVFSAGETTLTPESERSLVSLADILSSRPHLALEIRGHADKDQDRSVLAGMRQNENLKRLAAMVRGGTIPQDLTDVRDKGGAKATDEELRNLALARSKAVQTFLVEGMGISPDRVVVAQGTEVLAKTNQAQPASRADVFFHYAKSR